MSDLQEQTFRGISQDIYSWASRSRILKRMFMDMGETGLSNQLQLLLGENEEKRSCSAVEMYKLIWGNYVELGPIPPIELLQDLEYRNIFYSNYRDHTTHSIRTFLIGLYLYEENEKIRLIIDESFKDINVPSDYSHEDVFTITWILTSLCHDVGYIMENNEIETHSEAKKRVLEYINDVLQCPLSHTYQFSSSVSKEKENRFINENRIFIPKVVSLKDIEEVEMFGKLSSAAKRARLSVGDENGLLQYYSMAKQEEPTNKRGKFRDHGITSALLLLKVWDSYRAYVEEIKKYNYRDYYKSIYEKIESVSLKTSSLAPLVIIAAESISLHNIDKDIWDKDSSYSHNIDLDGFTISFRDSKDAMPIAFLLRLCDELQMWDRPKFRAPKYSDKSVHSCDISMKVSNAGVFLRFFNDDGRYRNPGADPDGSFYKLRETLKKYLQSTVLNDILKYGDPPVAPDLTSLTEKKDNEGETKSSNEVKMAVKSESDWLVGAVNLDEDFHFSSFYLTQSLEGHLPEEYKQFGYSNIVAIYDDFNETYYIPKKECVTVSEKLIKTALDDPSFFENIIKQIMEHIKALDSVFSMIKPDDFKIMTKEELYRVYVRHNKIHKELYTYARIPEALDRGNSTFTSYLRDYLRRQSSDFANDAKLNEVFEALTYPENLSQSGQEIIDLCELIGQIKNHDGRFKVFSENNNRTLIQMDDEIRSAIEEYKNKWAFWGYHGYRNRVLRDFNYFVEKLKVDIKSDRVEKQSKQLISDLDSFVFKKVSYCREYNIDAEHRLLFKLASKIGTVKIYRRYVQLKNFYYLDMLISQIATRFSVSEGVIRCMLPEEVESLLTGNRSILAEGQKRNNAGIFAVTYRGSNYEIVCGDDAKLLYSEMKSKTSHNLISKGELRGDPVSKGKTRSIGRIVKSGSIPMFERGNILICVDSDPDMFEYIKIAGAVLAESGGLTCHAAIVCRELRIPCIVRIPGLLENVHDGDVIDVDADTGKISISTSLSNKIIRSINCNGNISPNYIGRKASSLIQMKQQGMNVPNFICIPIQLLRDLFSELEGDGNGAESQTFISEIQLALDELDSPFYAIRSSTLSEDGIISSGAGQEITRLHVTKNDVLCTIENIINEINESQENVNGSIIVQKMIFGEISGVMFTCDPMNVENKDSSNPIIVEAVRGGNEHLTSGLISPSRYVIQNGQISFTEGDKWGGRCSTLQLQILECEGRKIENFFGSPQDIEWTIAENVLYILQSRNVTGLVPISRNTIAKREKKNSQLCISIYQNYALPIVLQNHMLRVAAVGKWIIDHWNNPAIKLDERCIIETLLLHDIGNIVKGEDDNFRNLFPDIYEMESFEYWVSIRHWVMEHYGNTDTEATNNIVKEIGVNQSVVDMIVKKQFTRNKLIYEENDFIAKICAYADQRVSPEGVMSLTGRLAEAVSRYRGVANASVNSKNRTKLIEYASKIESQIFENVSGTPDMITDKSIEGYITQLKIYKFKDLIPS